MPSLLLSGSTITYHKSVIIMAFEQSGDQCLVTDSYFAE
jgi:hypothetical protein